MTISAMKFADALDATLKHFCISAKEMATKSGALPPDARHYFYFNCLVRDIDEAGIATLLQAIAFKLKTEPVKARISGESLALTSG
jgi:hypothetical protein